MNKRTRLKNKLLSPASAILAVFSAILLIFAFPDFDFWFLAWVSLVPLFLAVEREKDSAVKAFLVGWVFGLVFFFGTCWWLTFAPITYAGMPWPLVYFFMFCAAAVVGILPGIFGALLSVLLKRFGTYAILFAPFLWTATEFLRMWLTGNNWNAIGYSQAFQTKLIQTAQLGGVYSVGFFVVVINVLLTIILLGFLCLYGKNNIFFRDSKLGKDSLFWSFFISLFVVPFMFFPNFGDLGGNPNEPMAKVIAIQPNVPMNGLTYEKFQKLLARHVELAETALKANAEENPESKIQNPKPIIIFPESPMIFQYGRDPELQEFLRRFAVRNNASVLFNSAEMTADDRRILNSAVMIDARGEKIAQYDKIHLLPFGEYIPFPEPLASQMPAFVGNFEFGKEYDLLPLGDATGGVMICFESHFGELSREYARRGADVLIEMTNDGYLGKTPVLRQHLANSVFRAVETNRPLVRVTNVGVTAYITERGEVRDAAEVYREAARVWTVSKADGHQTLYVRYGDWFAWLCSVVSLAVLFFSFKKSYIYDKEGRKLAAIRTDKL